MKRFMPVLLVGLGLWSGAAVAATFITLDYPGGINTVAMGVDGNNVVGNYMIGPVDHGFLYNLSTSTFTALPDDPQATGSSFGTNPSGICGNLIVGNYYDSANQVHGFVYNLSTSAYTTLDDPNVAVNSFQGTFANGISGNNIVGVYSGSSNGDHGFLYSLSTSAYTTLDDPLAARNGATNALAISGNFIAGCFQGVSGGTVSGFLYNISTQSYTTLTDPLAVLQTVPTGIQGNTVFGFYADSSNSFCPFLYDISTATYTTLDFDLPGPISMTGEISGNTIAGTYTDTVNDNSHGFVATIPEPSDVALLAVGVLGLAAYAWRKRKRSLALVLESTLAGQDSDDLHDAGPGILSMPPRWTGATRRAA